MPRLESTHDEVLAPATRMLIGIVVAPVPPIEDTLGLLCAAAARGGP